MLASVWLKHRFRPLFSLAVLLLTMSYSLVAAADSETRIASDMSISYGFGTSNSLTSIAAERTWAGRLHLALRAGVGFWPGFSGPTTTVVTEETAEIGFQLHPSRAVGLLLGWRAGHSYFKKDTNQFASTIVNVFAFEPVTRISYEINADWLFRFVPFTINFYKKRVWSLTVGFEIGIARRY